MFCLLRRIGLVLVLLPVSVVAHAEPELTCETAGVAAEQEWHLPPGLLAAIGRIEAGRTDPQLGRVVAWPWTINVAGQGHYFEAKADALAAVQSLQMRGVQSIDVGCFQINLMFHPGAFASLEQAFDMQANAGFAARFMSDLHDRAGSWETAIAWYHSATPGVGEPYRDRVLAEWNGGGVRILPATAGAAPAAFEKPITSAMMLPQGGFAGVHVWGPTWATAALPIRGATAAIPVVLHGNGGAGGGRLPHVITP